jgi:hypothetical protein
MGGLQTPGSSGEIGDGGNQPRNEGASNDSGEQPVIGRVGAIFPVWVDVHLAGMTGWYFVGQMEKGSASQQSLSCPRRVGAPLVSPTRSFLGRYRKIW